MRFAIAFPTTADGLPVGSGFLLCLGLTATVSFLTNRHFTEIAASQPVIFNHRLHVEDEGLECAGCHMYYEDEPRSGFPTSRMCALCHLEPLGENAEEQKLVSLLEAGSALEWDSLFRQPPHVFFSHRRHVSVAEIECATCHGDIGSSERPPLEKRPLGMEVCLECHEREGASNACTKCHR